MFYIQTEYLWKHLWKHNLLIEKLGRLGFFSLVSLVTFPEVAGGTYQYQM